ncbi:hypothetical protein D3C87_1306040 [compost metagenome]
MIRAVQRAAELEVIRRVSEDRVDGMIRERFQGCNAITLDDGVNPCVGTDLMLQVRQRKNSSHITLATLYIKRIYRLLWLPNLVTKC